MSYTTAPESIWAVTEPDDVSAQTLGDVYAQQLPDGMVGNPVEYIRADLAKQIMSLRWQPIETAPRDGTMILLLCASDCHPLEDTTGSYVTMGQCSSENTGADWWQTVGWSWSHDCFVSLGDMDNSHTDSPTHWMPLPPKPA